MYTNEELRIAEEKYSELLSAHRKDTKAKLSATYSPEVAEEIIAALDSFHSFITEGDALGWLANLYDAEFGGFYFSNSARDNEGFLPDLESTLQALGFLYSSRAADQIAPTLGELLPAWLQEDIVRFVKKLQDPESGYFYHPQWEKAETDRHPGRLGRDLGWAIRLLSYFGQKPTYDTPTGIRGDGIGYDGTVIKKNEVTRQDAPAHLPRPHLESRESFAALLSELEGQLSVKSWDIGNRFEAEAEQIIERDRQLAAAGLEGGLSEMLAEWFAAHQNPSNGAWTSDEKISYDSTNGLLKISATFNKLGLRFPNPVLGIRTAIQCIIDPDVPDTVCHALNPWYAVNVISANVEKYSRSEDELVEVDYLRKYISANCAGMIGRTVEKLSRFKVGDGSFIYKPKRKGIAQGMRVAPDDVFEGDINATTIAARAIIEHIYDIIGVEMPPLYSGADVMRFLNIIEEKHSGLEKMKADSL